ncbi:MAG: ABC transporter permease [Vicinamibacteria bacterium]
MPSLARRNLLHDRVRLVVTLTGIVFAVVLSAIQLGLFVGFQRATADVIRHAGADVWVRSRGVTHLESAVAFSERKLYDVRTTPGVAEAQKHIVRFGQWKKPDGGDEGVMIIGVDLAGTMARPWNLVAGTVAALDEPDAVIVDELYLGKLGIAGVGDVAEINGRRVRVAGLTRGIRTFTTAPPVFTSFKRGLGYARMTEDQTLYLLVRTAPGADPREVAAAIESRVTDVTAEATADWRASQEFYWMFGTGAGITVLIAAALGLLVGVVVVAQTIYSATVDHIREYGTLKAMGATNGYLYRVILQQAAISAVAGFGIGIAIALAVSRASLAGTTAIIVEPPLVAALFALTLGMCLLASVVSIHKVTRLDPALVFKG